MPTIRVIVIHKCDEPNEAVVAMTNALGGQVKGRASWREVQLDPLNPGAVEAAVRTIFSEPEVIGVQVVP